MTEIGEEIQVIAAFGRRKGLMPLRFMWSGRRIDIKEITYRWDVKAGERRIIHFSVTDGNNLYELSFDPLSIRWRLEGVEQGT